MRFKNETTDQVRVVKRASLLNDELPRTHVLYPDDEVDIPESGYSYEDLGYRGFEPSELERWKGAPATDPAANPIAQGESGGAGVLGGAGLSNGEFQNSTQPPANPPVVSDAGSSETPPVQPAAPPTTSFAEAQAKQTDADRDALAQHVEMERAAHADQALEVPVVGDGAVGQPTATTNLIGDPSVEAVEAPPVLANDAHVDGTPVVEVPQEQTA